ncbi:MAG TPA: gluconokinase, GntK/IdnK-type [Polyangiaceae bacterium]|nr:gluconokinase, GntK/IdnK-type [Polyangiaceae bacterium]
MVIIISGIAGSGKTTVGSGLALRLGFEFADADAYHSAENRAKMHTGLGLDDADREGWLLTLEQLVVSHLESSAGLVLACSALKESYRERLRKDPQRVVIFVLRVSPQILAKRLQKRAVHFAGPALLQSQIDTFEAPRRDAVVDGARLPSFVVRRIERHLCVLVGRSRLLA